jgi:hypothetical protein
MLSVNTAMGTLITLDANYEFSGGTAPTGTPPWLTAAFNDNGTSTVTLTLTATNLTGGESGEFVSEWCLNLDPALDPTKLTFNLLSKSGTFDNPTIATGVNSFKPDGDGKYDIQFSFATNDNHRFTGGETISYTITSSEAGLSANSLNVLSFPSGGHGPYLMASHVQNAPNGGSGWVAPLGNVPEPSTLALLGIGAISLLAFVRRKR